MDIPGLSNLESILDSLADGVFTVDRSMTITYFNRAASRITGIAASDARGRKCWEVLHSSLCDGSCAIDECIHSLKRVSNKSIFIVNAEGQKVPVSISAAPLMDDDGNIIGGVETFRDLSDIHLIRKEMESAYSYEDIVGKSPALTRIFSILPQISRSESTVLILGESGTGKELFARAIHNLSERKDGPFVAVNCGALPDTLLESELFGHKAGAFTDARKDRHGRFSLAKGGTIFLDEIGDMPLHLQVKILRVLQERKFEPLGSEESLDADVRIVAATNRNLEQMVQEGMFRQDLFYRLNVVTIRLPSLTERTEDIPLLISHFIQRLNARTGKDIQGVSEDVKTVLMRHRFPGNIRELENILEFAFILCQDGFIHIEHLPESMQPQKRSAHMDDSPMTMEEIKCLAVQRALRRNHGRKMKTCRELEISKDTLRRMIARCDQKDAK